MTKEIKGKEQTPWKDLQEISQQVLAEAKKMGASDAEVALNLESGLSTSVRLGNVETIEFNRDKSLSLTVYRGKRKGSVSTTDFSKEALTTLVEKACRIAEYTEEDEASGLPERDMQADNILDLDLYHPWEITADAAVVIAKECEDIARAEDKRISNSEGATLATHQHFRVYANSNGFLGSYPSTRHSLTCVMVGREGDAMQRDYDYTVARDPKDLASTQLVGKNAAQKTLKRLGARKLKTCLSPVIFEAHMAAGLMSSFITAISGGNLYRKTSFLVDHLGQKVFPDFVEIKEDPHILKALGSAPFDQEGVRNRTHEIVHEGKLVSYVLSSYSARRLKMKSTGNCGGVHNLIVKSGPLSLAELLKKMDRGLLVTEMMGHGINIVTGDYSRGASGFWVEKGVIQYPVEEITIAGNLRDMFLNLIDIGNDVEHRGNIFTGSILLDKMTVAGS